MINKHPFHRRCHSSQWPSCNLRGVKMEFRISQPGFLHIFFRRFPLGKHAELLWIATVQIPFTTMFRRFWFCPMALPQLMAPLQYNHPDPSISIQSSDMARHCHSLLSQSQSPLRMNEEPPMDNPGNWLQKLLSVSCQQTVCFGGKVKEWEKPG